MTKDLSIADLEDLMIYYLDRRGVSEEFKAGYLEAQRKSGWLRPGCPAWLRNSAGVYYAIPITNEP